MWVFLVIFILKLTEVFLNLTEVFPCFFLSCKANARVKLAKMGHGPHSSTLICICVINIHNTSCVLTCESLLLTCIHRTQRG